jgi:hypothetical protein
MRHSLLLSLVIASAIAQNNGHGLTIKQAERLALNAPPTIHAAQGKCCPNASGYETPAGSLAAPHTLIAVQVRCTCGDYTGALVDNYMVNPTTGAIWEGLEETGEAIQSKRLDALRKRMLRSK